MHIRAFSAAPIVTFYSLLCTLLLAAPITANAGTLLPEGNPAIPPVGLLAFCAKHIEECRTQAAELVIVKLTADRSRELDEVQRSINASIRPAESSTKAWDYPTDGTGDCNRFALAKRRELIERAWPRSSLLLATAITERGEGHLVLVVRTDRGDIVLDNRVGPPVDWAVLPYRWVSLQSPRSPVQWVSILSRS